MFQLDEKRKMDYTESTFGTNGVMNNVQICSEINEYCINGVFL